MKANLLLAVKMLRSTTAYKLKQFKIIMESEDEVIVYSINNCETFNHCHLAVMLDQVGCSNYIAYNHELSRLEMHIY